MRKKQELTKGKECIPCKWVLKCEGKPQNVACLHYEKRKDNGKDEQGKR